jgi:dienelactone hydrolase
MFDWETALTTADTNRVVRPLEWGFDWLADIGGDAAAARVARGEVTALEAMTELNLELAAHPDRLFYYKTPADFRLEIRYPELFPTNVRPETLEQEREYKRQAEVGELRRAPFLRFTSAIKSEHPENDLVNARWYEARPHTPKPGEPRRPKQAMIIMPQWNADAFSHNVFAEMFNRFGISCLRLSKPYHDVRRPAELERSDYAVSSNVGRTIGACRQAVADIRGCVDWLESQGYEQFGVLGTSLGSCYGYLAAAMDPRLTICAFNHVSTSVGDVTWLGQSTRHVRAAFEAEGLTREDVSGLFLAISPKTYLERFARVKRQVLMVYATYDLTFPLELSLEALAGMRSTGVDVTVKVLPCGHYTTGETPFKYMDGWFVGSFVWKAYRNARMLPAGDSQ